VTVQNRARSGLSHLVRATQQAVRGVLDLVYPPRCVACGADVPQPDEALCEACSSKIPASNYCRCAECGRELPVVESGCPDCGGEADFVWTAAPYKTVAPALHAMKYRGRDTLAAFLTRAFDFSAMARAGLSGFNFIAPVPLHSSRLRERGFNQSAVIAREISDGLGVPVRDDLLRRIRRTSAQAKLARTERGLNVSGVFASKSDESLEGRRVLVCDDVVTTGATVGDCARVLRNMGADAVGAVAIAHVDL
jgi:ComF family protein